MTTFEFFTLAWSYDDVHDALIDTDVDTIMVTQTGLPDGQIEVKISGDRVAVEAAADILDIDRTEIEEV